MNEYMIQVVIGFGAGFGIAFWVKELLLKRKLREEEGEAINILENARKKAETLVKEAELEAKDNIFNLKRAFDEEAKETRGN